MSDEDEIERRLRAFLLDELLDAGAAETLTDRTPLITSGVLDSIGTLTVVSFLEEAFAISLQPHETSVDNLDTIADMARFVRDKRRSGA